MGSPAQFSDPSSLPVGLLLPPTPPPPPLLGATEGGGRQEEKQKYLWDGTYQTTTQHSHTPWSSCSYSNVNLSQWWSTISHWSGWKCASFQLYPYLQTPAYGCQLLLNGYIELEWWLRSKGNWTVHAPSKRVSD